MKNNQVAYPISEACCQRKSETKQSKQDVMSEITYCVWYEQIAFEIWRDQRAKAPIRPDQWHFRGRLVLGLWRERDRRGLACRWWSLPLDNGCSCGRHLCSRPLNSHKCLRASSSHTHNPLLWTYVEKGLIDRWGCRDRLLSLDILFVKSQFILLFDYWEVRDANRQGIKAITLIYTSHW